MTSIKCLSPEVRELPVRMAFDQKNEHNFEAIAPKIVCTPQRLRTRVKPAEVDQKRVYGGLPAVEIAYMRENRQSKTIAGQRNSSGDLRLPCQEGDRPQPDLVLRVAEDCRAAYSFAGLKIGALPKICVRTSLTRHLNKPFGP